MHRFLRYIEGFAATSPTTNMRYYEGLSSVPWHNSSDFPLVADLESNFEAIRNEIDQLEPAQFRPESENIKRTGSWDVLMLFERGRKNADNCAACPITTEVIERHRTVRTPQGLIYFSLMKPGTHIAAHRGPTNVRLRCHLGIHIPVGDCAIRVHDEQRQWQEGRCLVFDDFHDHEAWNHTTEDRVVLIVDLWHPDFTERELALLEGLDRYTYFYASSLNRYWANAERAGKSGID